MTEREALEKCIELWDWIAEDPENNKKCDKASGMLNCCPCCQYVYENFVRLNGGNYLYGACHHCPIDWGTQGDVVDFYCEAGLEPPFGHKGAFALFIVAESNKDWALASKHAKNIADLARKALEELENE